MSEDEAGALRAIKKLRTEVIEPKSAEHGGRLFKSMGDGFLVEFHSVINAVACAVEIQGALLQDFTEIQLRIGINLGDVVVEDSDVFGDGVNIATRLEAIAPPGGIVVSSSVRDQVGNRLDVSFLDLGKLQLKNIADPVRAYSVTEGGSQQPQLRLAAQNRPSIAVLPLTNMSGEAEQEFFADGLTEDIITELSRFKELFVIARNSTFVFKGKSVNVRQVARELGVHYVVEGSVRKAGARVRITVQLIEAESGNHVWAERYDRQLEDIFAIQDEITTAIVSILPGRIEASRRMLASNRPTDNMEAYELVLGGKVLHHRSELASNTEALTLLDRAIELDPSYAHAHAWRACVLGQRWVYGWGDDAQLLHEIVKEVNSALALDDSDADVHRLAAAIGIATNDLEKAELHQNRALSLNPNYDLVVVQQGELLTWLGRADEGVVWVKRAMQLNPFHPPRYWSHLGRAYFTAGRFVEAIEALKCINDPTAAQLALLGASHVEVGDQATAANCVKAALEHAPDLNLRTLMSLQHYGRDLDSEKLKNAYQRAGFPE